MTYERSTVGAHVFRSSRVRWTEPVNLSFGPNSLSQQYFGYDFSGIFHPSCGVGSSGSCGSKQKQEEVIQYGSSR